MLFILPLCNVTKMVNLQTELNPSLIKGYTIKTYGGVEAEAEIF
jgi:hypothetical protein